MTRDAWTLIRDELEQEILDGRLGPGDKLPTEPELVERFQVGRHSVRRAVAELAREGKVIIEQGRGTFVETAQILTYSIGKRTRLRRNVAPQGFDVTSVLLSAEEIEAKGRIKQALQLPKGALVIKSTRCSYADGVPIAFGAAYHSVERFADIVERRAEIGSMTETYRSYGIEDYLRGETTMHARLARAHEAQQLKQHSDLPVIVVRAIDTLPDGTPISFSEVIWSATRVKFSLGGD